MGRDIDSVFDDE
jgi:hypothetical protein